MSNKMKKELSSHLVMQSDRHRKLHHVPGLGLTMDVHNGNELCFISLVTAESSIFLVHEGEMQVEGADVSLTARAGEFLLLQAGVPLKITHRPAENGQHSACGVLLGRRLVADAAPATRTYFPSSALLLGARDKGFSDSFYGGYHALRQAAQLPPSIVIHRMSEMLMWLALESVFFRPIENVSLSARLRDLLSTQPGNAWPEPQVAKALGQSPATLRRRLAAEATSFREILSETRMLHALRLLYSTDESVGNIARHAGYACQSRFAQCFHKRFGYPPSAVRGHKRGTK